MVRAGAVLKVEMPPAVGFESSAWQPAAATFEGKQRIERSPSQTPPPGLLAAVLAAPAPAPVPVPVPAAAAA
eukprot:561565-Rhodomonas_salina.1